MARSVAVRDMALEMALEAAGGARGARTGAAEPSFDLPPVLSDPNERRLTVCVLQTWSNLRRGAEHPQASDIPPALLGTAAGNCAYIRVGGRGCPQLEWVGDMLLSEAGLAAPPGLSSPRPDGALAPLVPAGSMLGCLLEHAGACAELAAPLDIESQSSSLRGCDILYRGTLLPLAGPDGGVARVLGAISWRECAPAGLEAELCAALRGAGLGRPH